ncbi:MULTISPECIES: hypothetical protein [Chelativorans]|uniref:Uncharacterized protein n=1 Tax=Chelativorans sp. (strain BNC1) TaxID=266779 RepID=Q11BQ6_CHESB|nr:MULTISPECIES: hypothetical protein [Chelativorans]
MSEFDVEVIGAGSPRKPDGARKRTFRAARRLAQALLLRPRILVLSGSAAFVLVGGTPHVGWDYQCRHPMTPGQPCRSVDYCAYYGVQGRRIVFPEDGETCRVVNFLRIDWQRIV